MKRPVKKISSKIFQWRNRPDNAGKWTVFSPLIKTQDPCCLNSSHSLFHCPGISREYRVLMSPRDPVSDERIPFFDHFRTVSFCRILIFKSGVFWQTEAEMTESGRTFFRVFWKCTEFAENGAINFSICSFGLPIRSKPIK